MNERKVTEEKNAEHKVQVKVPEGKRTAIRHGMNPPRVWQRCLFCGVRKKCKAAGLERGSSACSAARYVNKGEGSKL
jgi:hypothetical protein